MTIQWRLPETNSRFRTGLFQYGRAHSINATFNQGTAKFFRHYAMNIYLASCNVEMLMLSPKDDLFRQTIITHCFSLHRLHIFQLYALKTQL